MSGPYDEGPTGDVPIVESRVLVFDLETTGLGEDDAIVELAAVLIDRGQVGPPMVTRINPGFPIPAAATEIHGLDDAAVAAAPLFAEIADRVAQRLGEVDAIAGYNAARFDAPFLNREMERAGHPWRIARPDRVIDPFVWLRRRHMHRSRKLSDVCAAFGVPQTGAHSAAGDAVATAHLLLAFVREGVMPRDVDNTKNAQERWVRVVEEDHAEFGGVLYRDWLGGGRDVVRLARGDQRGLRLEEVDSGFLRWLLERPDTHPGAAESMRAELRRRSAVEADLFTLGTTVEDADGA